LSKERLGKKQTKDQKQNFTLKKIKVVKNGLQKIGSQKQKKQNPKKPSQQRQKK
jgi:hypothetical protein